MVGDRMISILVIVIIILVVSFIMALIISGNKDYNHASKLTDDPSILFEEENKNIKNNNQEIADEIKIEDSIADSESLKQKEEIDVLFDDELI